MRGVQNQKDAVVAALSEATSNSGRGAYAFSVDVEDYFQVWAFSDVIHPDAWDNYAFRAGEATLRMLDLLDAHSAKATFFTLGWVAEREPALIREIVARGHELASHGYDHRKVYELTRSEFLADVTRTKNLLEDISGVTVSGFRAPGFSIDARSPWAYDALIEAGYIYSSSKHPIAHDHYGDPDGLRTPYHPVTGNIFTEAPVATIEVFGRRVSCAGGGWFRALPYALSSRLIKRASETLGGPIIFYVHPWEIDPGQPKVHSASLKSKLRHYINLDRMEAKLAKLLDERRWERIDHVLDLEAMRAAA